MLTRAEGASVAEVSPQYNSEYNVPEVFVWDSRMLCSCRSSSDSWGQVQAETQTRWCWMCNGRQSVRTKRRLKDLTHEWRSLLTVEENITETPQKVSTLLKKQQQREHLTHTLLMWRSFCPTCCQPQTCGPRWKRKIDNFTPRSRDAFLSSCYMWRKHCKTSVDGKNPDERESQRKCWAAFSSATVEVCRSHPSHQFFISLGGVLLLFVILHAQPTGWRDWAKLQCANCGGSNWVSCANKSKESNAAVAFVLSLLCYIQLPSHTGCNLRNNHVIFWWTVQSVLVLSARDGFSAGKKRHFYYWLQF